MRLKVRDVLGVAQADIPMTGITLVAGINGAGKSSLLSAAAAVALRRWVMRGQRLKAEAQNIVREGAENGAAVLEWGSGSLRMRWPDGVADSAGDGDLRKMGSAFAIGADRWMEAETRARLADLAERLDTRPGVTDVRLFLEEKGVEKAKAATLAEAIIKKVEEQANGWDAVHKSAQESGLKLKGRWEQVTGQRFGPTKAATWTPAGLLAGETYTLEDAEAALVEAQAALQRVLVAGAVAASELEQQEKVAATAPERRAKVSALRAEAEALHATLEKLRSELAALPPLPDAARQNQLQAKCPHCDEVVVVDRRSGHLAKLDAAPAAPPSKEDLAKRAGVERAIADQEAQARDLARTISHAEAEAMVAERAAAKVEEMKAAPRADTRAIAEATADVARLETRRDAIRTLLAATGIYDQWRAMQPTIEALSPGGVRQVVLERRCTAFNAQLAALSEAAGWLPVAITAEADATYGGRSYALLSESERWRVDLTLQVAFAMQEKAALLLVDRLDVLTPQARLGAVKLMYQTGIPALVAMTQPNPDRLPDLAGMKMGRSCWIEHGIVRLL